MKLIVFIVLSSLALCACASPAPSSDRELQSMFAAFMRKFAKVYRHDQLQHRFQIFKANVATMTAHNAAVSGGRSSATYTMGVNAFSDLTFAEFKAARLGFDARASQQLKADAVKDLRVRSVAALNRAAAASVDWRTAGAVTPVKDQGRCGSCWSFSATGALEAMTQMAGHALPSLSEQQLVDCAAADFGNHGCAGGNMYNAFYFAWVNGGLCSESSYPYVAKDDTCKSTCTNVANTQCNYITEVDRGNEAQLLQAATQAPTSVAIEVNDAFQHYAGGVFNAACGVALNHGVLLVGYAHDNASNLDYYIVKNSWGASWGESGYVRMVRGKNECGIAEMANFPTI